MAIQKFEELLIWQKSQDFCVLIYKHFANIGDFAFRDEITRASVSISNNVAEGFDRNTNPVTLNDFYFLQPHLRVNSDQCNI
ncbi:MAG: four helix bundle protein [Psychroserpens sp.]|uniref:four helix bundle protein n=1 Tax=Psychroserpens sp. TaxID=2020870 RepID=UPI003C843457